MSHQCGVSDVFFNLSLINRF